MKKTRKSAGADTERKSWNRHPLNVTISRIGVVICDKAGNTIQYRAAFLEMTSQRDDNTPDDPKTVVCPSQEQTTLKSFELQAPNGK